jgi:hypothetical protein
MPCRTATAPLRRDITTMLTHDIKWCLRRVLAWAVPLTLTMALSASAAADHERFPVVPPGETFGGKTYGQWSQAWWQWAASMDASDSPLVDPTGEKCGMNQSGPVFFLAGVAAAPSSPATAERTCRVPADVGVLVPIINSECSSAPNDCGASSDYTILLAANAINLDGATAKIRLDGKHIPAVLTASPAPPFDVSWSEENPFGVGPGDAKSVAFGFYTLLRPLKPGVHRLSFTGSVPGFTVSVTYRLIVSRK